MTEKAIRSKRTKTPSTNTRLLPRIGTVTLGLAASVVFSRMFIPAVDADTNPAVQGPAQSFYNDDLQQKNTAVSEGVAVGLGNGAADRSDLWDGMVLAQATTESTGNSNNHGKFLLSRTNELLAVDNREVDEVAARLKEIIRARYRAENENIESLNTIDDLRVRLVELENLLQNTHAKNDDLRTEQLALEEKIAEVIYERDEALNSINAINDEMKGHIGSVQALKAETQNAGQLLNSKEQTLAELTDQLNMLTAELESAQAEADTIAGQLAQKENDFNNLALQLEGSNTERDDAIEASMALQNELSAKENSLLELNALLDTAAQNRASAESTITELELSVEEKANTVAVIQTEMSEKDNLLEGLKMQIQLLSEEKESSISQAAEIDSLLSLKTDNISDLEFELASLKTQKSEALAQAGSNLDKVTSQLEIAIVERDDALQLADTLQSELTEQENKLLELNAQLDTAARNRLNAESRIAELQLSMGDTESAVVTAQAELSEKNNQLSELQLQIEQLTTEKDESVTQFAEIDSLLNLKTEKVTDLEYQLASLKTEKDQAVEQVNLLQDKLTDAESATDELLSNNSNLTEKLGLFETQATDADRSLIIEQEAHVQSKAALTALQSEISGLKEEVEDLVGEKETLLTEASQLRSTSAELYGSQQAIKKELEVRENDLKLANEELSALNENVLMVKNERDTAVQTIESLGDEVAVLKKSITDAQSEHQISIDAHNEDFAQRKAELDRMLAAQNSEIAELNKTIVTLNSDIEKQEESSQLNIANKNDSIAQLRKKITDIQKERDQLDKLHKEGGARLVKLTTQLSGFASGRELSDKEIQQLKSLNGDLDSQLAEMKQKLEDAIAESERKALQHNDEMQQLRVAHTELEAREKTALGQISSLERGTAKLNEELSLSQSNHSSAEEQLESLKAQLLNYEKELYTSNARLDEFLIEQTVREEKLARAQDNMESQRLLLTDQLYNADLGDVTVQETRDDNSIPIRLGNADFFAAGSAQLSLEGRQKLSSLAAIIQTLDAQRIVVEGHTDSVPIGIGLKNKFESNWELSVSRAAAAVRHLQAFTKLDPSNLTAAGFGEYRPIAENETENGRKQNRRVEIVLYPVELEPEYETVSSTVE